MRDRMPDNQEKEMLNQSFRNRSKKSVSALLSASALAMAMGLSQPAQASEPFLGQIETFGFNFAPRGWAFCDGQLLPIAQNSALFALLGTTFGGDGRTTFALPDLRGRVAVHVGNGPGLSTVTWGQKSGSETRTLNINNLPSHTHTAALRATTRRGNTADPEDHTLAMKSRTNIYQTAAPEVDMQAGSVVIGNTGGSQSFSIRDPYLGIYHSIAITGIFPSRN
jgi:microcystin-dependent protein